MHFDLVDLKLFVSTAEESSLTRGAAKVHLSLPAASLRMKNLEQSLGTQLFDRASQGLTLRPAGQALLGHAREVLRQLAAMRSEVGEYARGVKGHLRLLINASAITEFIPHVLHTFLIEHPEVNIDLREKHSLEIVRALSEGRADIGIVAGSVLTQNLDVVPYRTDRLVLATGNRHPLATRSQVNFTDTLDYDFIGLQEGSAIQAVLDRAAAEVDRKILTRIHLGSYEMICRMIAAGIGIGVLPESAVVRLAEKIHIRPIPLTDTWSVRDMAICARDIAALPAFGKALIDLLIEDASEGASRRPLRVEYS